ncbi:MAG: S-layer homology domain-containing protein [Clostridia bacterium]|nr:S-layer homology domain-containing protein [Clostridia bacterium]
MKLRKIFATALACVMTASAMSFTAFTSAQSADSGVLTIHYSKIQKNNVNGKKHAVISASEDKDMGSVIKIEPIPSTSEAGAAAVDGYSIDNLGIDMTRYNYLTVEYKLVTNAPVSVKPYFNFHPGPGKSITKRVTVRCGENLVKNEWSKFTVNIGTGLKPVIAEGAKNLSQIHFLPFGDYPPSMFNEGDCMLIRNFIFSEENPNPNALHQISFESGAGTAEGTAPANMEGKSGDKITLPEIPFTIKGLEAAGWYNEADGILYQPGDTYTIGESGTSFVVRWVTIFVPEDFVELDFVNYSNGVCNGENTAKLNKVEIDGMSAIEIVPNPAYEKNGASGTIILDGWSYGGAKINLNGYSTLMILYKYVTDTPVAGAKAKFNIMKQNTFKGHSYLVSRENFVANRWALTSFDLTVGKEKKIEGVDPVIMQAHVIPLGDTAVKNLNENDRIYVAKIYAIPEASTASGYHDSYINGYADGTFGVNGNMTRAEACTIVARLCAGGDDKVPADKTTAFSDVLPADWYHKYVSYVESLGYLKSYSGEFKPNQAITRAEFVELVYNMGLLSDNGKNGTFTDVPADHARAEVVSAAGKAGLVNGYDNGDGTFSFKPDNTITRAEVVKVINNAYGRAPSAQGISASSKKLFSDVTEEHWAFADIIDASVGHISYYNEDGKEVWKKKFIEDSGDEDFTPDYDAGTKKMEETSALIDKRIEEIKNAPDSAVSVKGKTYYVSASGSDDNDGLSADKPFATAKKAGSVAREGDAVLFNRGDMWREPWAAVANVSYGAYGEGEKPIFNGNILGDLADESRWTLLEGTTNIWALGDKVNDVGNVIINGGEKTLTKVMPRIVAGKYQLNNKDVEIKDMLTANETFVIAYGTVNTDGADVTTRNSTLYVRCDEGNPGKVYDSVEIAQRSSIISAKTGNTFENLKLIYTGGHAISMGTVNNVTFRNLEIGWIGGSAQHYSKGNMTRYGNGIEVYGGCNGFTIDSCYIYQCYDAGITHQYSAGGAGMIIQQNVYFKNNVIDKCIYNIEYFIGAGDTASVERYMKNINYTDNLLARSGEGWGHDPSRSASIKGWELSYNRAEEFRIENNTFFMDKVNACDIGANSAVWLPVLKGNTYIQRYGNTFTKMGANGSTQYNFNGTAVDALEKIGETEAKLYYVPADVK